MKGLYAAAFVLFLASTLSLAQVKGFPASVTSSAPGPGVAGHASFGPPASVTSVGPNGWSGGFKLSTGPSFNHYHHGRRLHGGYGYGYGNGFGYGYPVYGYYPGYSYPYGYGPDYGYDPYGIYNPYYDPSADPRPSYPITYDTADVPPPGVTPSVDDEPPLPTDRQRVRDSDRYGDHYTDARERSRRAQQDQDSQQAENRPPPPRSNPDSYPATTLVFKDGRQIEIHNFAIIGDYVFDLAEGRARKYRISDLDLPATMKLNDENGVSFHLPHEPAPGQ